MSIFKVTTDSTGTILDRSRAPDCLSPVSQLAIIVGHVLAESTTVVAVVGTAVMKPDSVLMNLSSRRCFVTVQKVFEN